MSREFHEKIAAALDALADASVKQPTPPAKSGNRAADAAASAVVDAKKKLKLASDTVADRYARMTGEELPDEVSSSPAAVEALRKVAAASAPVNELGEPGDRFDRSGSRPTGRTKEARIKDAYASFGNDLLQD